MTGVISFIDDLRRRYVELAVNGEQLRYRAPKGVLTAADRELLGAHKAAIIIELQGRAGGRGRQEADTPAGRDDGRAQVAEADSTSTVVLSGHGAESRMASQKSQKWQGKPPHENIAIFATQTLGVTPAASESAAATDAPAEQTVRLGDRVLPYFFWDGAVLDGDLLGFDTETALIQGHEIPELALASASAGATSSCLIHPDQVGRFILAHPRARLVFHNCAFDFWVIDRHLRERGEEAARSAWWTACDENRMSDTILLDQLLELARRDAEPRPRDLAVVGKRYAGLEIDKNDPYRMRYGEIIGRDWADVEEGFFTYAIKDPIVTLQAYRRMVLDAHQLMATLGRNNPDVRDDAIERFGLLSEFVQVKGTVALAQVSRYGMHLDRALVEASASELRGRRDAAFEALHAMRHDLFKTRTDKETGQVVLRLTKSGAPSRSDKVLQEQLARVIDDVRQEAGQDLAIPRTKKGLSQSAKVWSEYEKLHPFLGSWIAYEGLAKLCQFFAGLRAPVVHPDYRGLVRTGRTSCSSPNVQQIPRDSHFRQVFVPSPGHLLLAVDYSYIELRTLAAVCLKRYGRSVLADVIRRGIDPHCYTASLILGVGLEEFMTWEDDETVVELNGKRQARKKHFKEARQFAKPINFGVPGGLGAASLVAYAWNTYHVEMTLEQAQAFRQKLITEIYPELTLYLAEDGMALLAHNLGVPTPEAWDAFDWKRTRTWYVTSGIKNIVRGKTLNSRGKPYSQRYYEGVWDTLNRLCVDPDLKPLLAPRQGSEALYRRLFGAGVLTLTGRLRGRVSYSQCRNTPFQGLAADGAKLALWRLVGAGFRVIGFVHDEVLIELPDEGGYVSLDVIQRVKAILREEMASVLFGGIPVDCEATLSTCWSKEAELDERDAKVYPWSPAR
jgi:hypothetical protein